MMRYKAPSAVARRRTTVPLPLLVLAVSLLVTPVSCRNVTSAGKRHGREYYAHNGHYYAPVHKPVPVSSSSMVSSNTVEIDWVYNMDGTPLTAAVGETLRFVWEGYHNVYTMADEAAYDTCSFAGGSDLGDTSPVEYTVDAADAGSTLYFGCQVGNHCGLFSMRIAVQVEDTCPPTVPGTNTFSLAQYADHRKACTASCNAAGFCCTLGSGGCMHVPCATGCHIAWFSKNRWKCKQECRRANEKEGEGACQYTWNHAQIWQAGFNPLYNQDGVGVDKCVGPEECGCVDQKEGEDWGWADDCGNPKACETGCELAHKNHRELFFHGEDVKICETPPLECFETCEVDGCAEEKPRFLFAGQSNMEGHPHDSREGMFDSIVDILNAGEGRQQTMDKLVQEIRQAEEATNVTSANEARFLYDMSLRGLLEESIIRSPMDTVSCSFTNPNENPSLSCEQDLTQSNCGYEYGPELMFGHAFSRLETIYKQVEVGITKVAVGGTEIEKHWMQANAAQPENYWNNLVEAIVAAEGSLKAFVWFQGENDSFEPANRDGYLENLTQFVADVRKEMQERSAGFFESPEDVPVVIVELGSWIWGIDKTVIEAQRTFVKRTPNTALVKTGSSDIDVQKMTAFYHFDAASLLIIGDRIATALATLLDPNATRPPTAEPTASTESPTKGCTQSKKAQFFLKANKNGKETLKNCKWLEKKTDKLKKKICAKFVAHGTGEVQESAQEACQKTCASCGACYQNINSIFFAGGGTGDKEPVYLTCKQLKQRNKDQKKKLCKIKAAAAGTYGVAKEVCKVICKTGGC